MRFAFYWEAEVPPLVLPLLIQWALTIRKQLYLVILITTEKQILPPLIGELTMIFIFFRERVQALSAQHPYLDLTAVHPYLFLQMILMRMALPILPLRPTATLFLFL